VNRVSTKRGASSDSEFAMPKKRESSKESSFYSKHSKQTLLSTSSGNSATTDQILRSLTSEQKQALIAATIFKQQTSNWSKQLEKERAQLVPTMLCRICNQKIYADKSKEHSDLC